MITRWDLGLQVKAVMAPSFILNMAMGLTDFLPWSVCESVCAGTNDIRAELLPAQTTKRLLLNGAVGSIGGGIPFGVKAVVDEELAVNRANRLLDQMRAALKAGVAGRTPAEQAAAVAELETLISVIVNTQPRLWERRNDCQKWSYDVQRSLDPFDPKYVKVGYPSWTYWLSGVPGTDWRMMHYNVRVTLPGGGGEFYFDDGWWGHAFTKVGHPLDGHPLFGLSDCLVDEVRGQRPSAGRIYCTRTMFPKHSQNRDFILTEIPGPATKIGKNTALT